MSKRVGILGGTFDPFHRGHLDLGDTAQGALDLTTVLVVPSHLPPHRPRPAASAFHRFAMAALAVADRPGWRASEIELERQDPSYTVSTLQHFHHQGYAADELFFILGADAFADITLWRDYPAFLDAAQFVVVSRPGHPVSGLRARLPMLSARMTDVSDLHSRGAASIVLIHADTADVSATAIRQRIAEGHSIVGMVPLLVQQHIEQHGLYGPSPSFVRHQEEMMNHPAGRLHGQG